jgi:signal transduction histidine kinase
LDNAEAYRRIEELNATLEQRIDQRTKELAQANEELTAANTQLRVVDEQKDLFLGVVSHELRGPLAAIQGYADNILDGIVSTPEKHTFYLTRIRDNAARLARLSGLMLDVARIKAGHLELDLSDVNVTAVINDSLEQLRGVAEHKSQHLTWVPPETPLMVLADADKLTQVVTNLIDNAIKYTPHGGSIMMEVEAATSQHAVVRVRDTGPVIPRDQLAKIFDPFYRVGAGGNLRKSGLGLGLWIVKQFIELQGGTIAVESDAGRGTTFELRVPLIPCAGGTR